MSKALTLNLFTPSHPKSILRKISLNFGMGRLRSFPNLLFEKIKHAKALTLNLPTLSHPTPIFQHSFKILKYFYMVFIDFLDLGVRVSQLALALE